MHWILRKRICWLHLGKADRLVEYIRDYSFSLASAIYNLEKKYQIPHFCKKISPTFYVKEQWNSGITAKLTKWTNKLLRYVRKVVDVSFWFAH